MKQTKKIISLVLILLICLFIPYTMLPKYKIYNSVSCSNSSCGTRDTKLKVIVYHFWNHHNDEFLEEIRQEYAEINDNMDTSLEMNLYYSKWHDEPFKTKMFYK